MINIELYNKESHFDDPNIGEHYSVDILLSEILEDRSKLDCI